MAIVMKMVAPGATTEQYDQVNESLGISGDEDAPDGLILHMCGVTDDGIMIVDVWESPEKLQAFFESGVQDALENAGIEADEPQIHRLHNMIPQGSGTGDNVLMEITVDAGPDVYDDLISEMPTHIGDGSGHPVVAHVAAVTDDGKMYVIDIWESPEAFGAFAESELAPHAGDRLGEINPSFSRVHNVIRGNASVTA